MQGFQEGKAELRSTITHTSINCYVSESINWPRSLCNSTATCDMDKVAASAHARAGDMTRREPSGVGSLFMYSVNAKYLLAAEADKYTAVLHDADNTKNLAVDKKLCKSKAADSTSGTSRANR